LKKRGIIARFCGFLICASAWLITRRSPDLQLVTRPACRTSGPVSNLGRARGRQRSQLLGEPSPLRSPRVAVFITRASLGCETEALQCGRQGEGRAATQCREIGMVSLTDPRNVG
jgi:hypothetical protein